jgi:hypothetical protein
MKQAIVKLWKSITGIWPAIVHWFEYGDLVPLLVLVSAVHYAVVLSGKDEWYVAVAIGLLVDLGHFRTVRAAVRYPATKKRGKRTGFALFRWLSRYKAQAVVRWLIAAGMTVISLAYHQQYYGNWWFSIPLPLLIASLAWLQRVDIHVGERKPAERKPAGASSSQSEPAMPAYICGTCGQGFASQQGLNAHQRSHANASERTNGHAKEKVSV